MISGFVSLCQTLSLTVFSCVSFLSLLSRTPHCCFPVLFSYFPVFLAFFFVSQDISLQFVEDYTTVSLLISPLRSKFSKVIPRIFSWSSQFIFPWDTFLLFSDCPPVPKASSGELCHYWREKREGGRKSTHSSLSTHRFYIKIQEVFLNQTVYYLYINISLKIIFFISLEREEMEAGNQLTPISQPIAST